MEEKAGIKALSDDILEAVNGGLGKDYDDALAKGMCPHCGSSLKNNGAYFRCTDCYFLYDEYGNEIGGDD